MRLHSVDHPAPGYEGDADKGPDYEPKRVCFIATEPQRTWMSGLAKRHLDPHAFGRMVVATYRFIAPTLVLAISKSQFAEKLATQAWRAIAVAFPRQLR
jgi:hypothetical protein